MNDLLEECPQEYCVKHRLDRILDSTQAQAPAGNVYGALLLISAVLAKSLNLLWPQFPPGMNIVCATQDLF